MASPSPTTTVAGAVHQIQLSLVETSTCTERHLFAAGDLLSLPDFEDVVVERSIAGLCGYPLCPNSLPPDRPRIGRFRVVLREHRVYDQQETYKYCSPHCVIGSRAFSGSLMAERCSDLSSSKIQQVLGLFGQGASGENLGKDGDMGLSNLKIREKTDAEAAVVSLDEWIGPSDGIEGYVPQYDRRQGSKFSSDMKPTRGADGRGSVEVDFVSTVIVGDEINVVPPNKSSLGTEDVSEMIAKQLEDVVISEKKIRKNKTSSKSSKSKPIERINENMCDTMDSSSSIVIGDCVNAVTRNISSLSMQDHSKQLGNDLKDVVHSEKKKATRKTALKEFEDGGQSGRRAELKETARKEFEDEVYSEKKIIKETALKSSMRSSGSKVESRSVKWADGRLSGSLEERRDDLDSTESSEVSPDEDDNSLRFASAEACAAALIQAAEVVATGESEVGDAVFDAGILILPQSQCGDDGDAETDEDMFEFDRGFVKWPKKPVLLDTDMFDVEDSWHDTPPEGFNLTLSSFATMWMSLFGWITCSSLAYIYGHDESSQDDFLLVNGREYPHKIVLRDGKSSEIRQTLDGCVCRALPGLVMNLRLPTPISTLEKAVGRLLDTMTYSDAIPSFRTKQWHVLVLLFIDALSVHRIPTLAPHVANRDMLVHKVLCAAQVTGEEYESMRDLIMPLGRLPQFFMHCGG